jgi:hypothetical protein
MKQIIITLSIFLMATISVTAQDFAVKAGYNNLNLRSSVEDVTVSEDGSGFYVGFLTDIFIAENLSLRPELQFNMSFNEGEELKNLALPIMLSYRVGPKFSLQAGPQLEYLLEEDSEIIDEFGLGLGAGATFDISDRLFVDGRYVFGLSNRLDDDIFDGEDVDLKFNYIQIGLGYKF